MATFSVSNFTVTDGVGFSPDLFFPAGPADPVLVDSSTVTYGLPDGRTVVVSGTFGPDFPPTGVIGAVTLMAADGITAVASFANVAGVDFTAFDTAWRVQQSIPGNLFALLLGGNDAIQGTAGGDVLIGGPGVDTVSYGNDGGTSGLVIDLGGPKDADGFVTVAGANGESDKLKDIENVSGTANGDTLTGDAFNNEFAGEDGNDLLQGMDGNDTLYGGMGQDTLSGGAGSDQIGGGEGNDSIDGGDGADVVLGEAGDDEVAGAGGNDTLYGGDGNDSIDGGDGEDGLAGGSGQDLLSGGAGLDVLSGDDGDDTLSGGDGQDFLYGGAGNDTIDGGAGPGDTITYFLDAAESMQSTVDPSGDITISLVTGGVSVPIFRIRALGGGSLEIKDLRPGSPEGTDIVTGVETIAFTVNGGPSAPSIKVQAPMPAEQAGSGGFEFSGTGGTDVIDASVGVPYAAAVTIHAAGGSDVILGHGGKDTIDPGEGDDFVDGFGGADQIVGSLGNDTYIFRGEMTLVGGDDPGIDTIRTMVSLSLAAFAGIENLEAAAGAGPVNLTGNAANNVLTGNAANNRLDGGLGADQLVGGQGHDTYVIDNAGDVVIEGLDGGIDTVLTTVSTVLGANVEILGAANLKSTAALALTGNALANTITGNAGGNVLRGGGGNDRLAGGLGKDTLYGDAGKDVFVFDTKPALSNMDTIKDFSVPDDTIYLENSIFTKVGSGTPQSPRKLSAAAFWIGTKAHDTSDRIVYDKASGSLYYDPDGTGAAAQVRFAILPKNLKLTYADFFVI